MIGMAHVVYRIRPEVGNEEIIELMAASWPDSRDDDWVSVLAHSLTYICAYHEHRLIGFVNVA